MNDGLAHGSVMVATALMRSDGGDGTPVARERMLLGTVHPAASPEPIDEAASRFTIEERSWRTSKTWTSGSGAGCGAAIAAPMKTETRICLASILMDYGFEEETSD